MNDEISPRDIMKEFYSGNLGYREQICDEVVLDIINKTIEACDKKWELSVVTMRDALTAIGLKDRGLSGLWAREALNCTFGGPQHTNDSQTRAPKTYGYGTIEISARTGKQTFHAPKLKTGICPKCYKPLERDCASIPFCECLRGEK